MRFFLKPVSVAIILLLVCGGWVVYWHPLWVRDQYIRFTLWSSGVKSEYVQAGAYRLHYFEALPPAGTPDRPLILIHGLESRGEDWAEMIPALAADGFHVYVPDLLGYGRSPQPDVDYSIALQVKTMVDFLNAVHLAKPDVGGWSMGGWVAMKLAADHPERVNRLMIYDSAGTYFAASFEPSLFVPGDVAGLRKLLGTLSPNPPRFPPFAERDALRMIAREAWVVKRSTASMVSGRDLMDFRLHLIGQPMMIVWGSQDELIPLEVGEAIHRGIPQSVLAVIQGCGHMAPLECSVPVEKATVDFLRADPPPHGGQIMLKRGN